MAEEEIKAMERAKDEEISTTSRSRNWKLVQSRPSAPQDTSEGDLADSQSSVPSEVRVQEGPALEVQSPRGLHAWDILIFDSDTE
eukprot:15518539-Heterocapsa_arctica.AAC.1